MQRMILGGAAALLAGGAMAAAPAAHIDPPPRAEGPSVATITSAPPLSFPAPWWMRQPIIASVGEVQTHIPANRASFTAQFSSIDKSLATAQKNAADKVRTLAKTLQAYGADKAQVETSLSVSPIYEQYRDKDGNLQTNARADKIERYEVRVTFNVQVRDLAVLERAYAAVVSAHPMSIRQPNFQLEPDNETNTELFKAATADAARRAKLATEVTGAKLGRVQLIDPTGRACETDVLVEGAPRSFGADAGGVQEVSVTDGYSAGKGRSGVGFYAAAPQPQPLSVGQGVLAGEEVSPDQILPLQPPLEVLRRRVCVVYALE